MKRIVEVYVPALDKGYDFSLPSQMPTAELGLLIAQILDQETRMMFVSEDRQSTDCMLFATDESGAYKRLEAEECLADMGVKDGAKLIFV